MVFAVIVALPSATPVTTPLLTVAMLVSDEVHVILSVVFEGVRVALRVTVLPVYTVALVLSSDIAVDGIVTLTVQEP